MVYTLRKVFHYSGVVFGSSTPYLVFQFFTKTHLLNNSYYNTPLSKERQIIQDEVMKLHREGWGYTKIHKHLIENGYRIGKSRTCVDSIIKKRLKREEFLNQTITAEFNIISSVISITSSEVLI